MFRNYVYCDDIDGYKEYLEITLGGIVTVLFERPFLCPEESEYVFGNGEIGVHWYSNFGSIGSY